jgi:hypothetical protein
MSRSRIASAATLVAVVALSACSSSTTTTNTIVAATGTVTATLQTSTGRPVVGARAAISPDTGATCAPSDGSGSWSCSLPTGSYTLTFSGPGITTTAFSGVTVITAQTTALGTKVVPYSPIVLSVAAPPNPAGFNSAVNLTATASGGPDPSYVWTWTITRAAPAKWGKSKAYTTYVRTVNGGSVYECVTSGTSAASGSGPTGTGASIADGTVTWKYLGTLPAAPAITWTNGNASFTTETFQALTDPNAFIVRNQDFPVRPGPVGITVGDGEYMGYTVNVTVTNGGYSQNASATVYPASFTHGVANNPVGAMVVVTDGDANAAYGAYSWTMTYTPPSMTSLVSQATLHDGNTKYPWFIADVRGDYTLDNAAIAAWAPSTAYTTVGTYVRANGATYKLSTAGTSAASPSTGPKGYGTVTDGTAKWAYQSAYAPIVIHADTFSGVGACGSCHGAGGMPQAPKPQYAAWGSSAHALDPDIAGTASLFQNEILGLEHGGSTCLRCHTTGNDPGEVGNGGFSDRALADGWSYPAVLGTTAWAAVPDNLKQLDGVQCESCHGPVGILQYGTHTPSISYSASVCGRCHDYNVGSHHDRYSLWSLSPTGHSLRSLAQRGAADKSVASTTADATTGYISAGGGSCARCHTAQGFAAYVKQQLSGGATDDSDPCSPSATGEYNANVACYLVPDTTNVGALTADAWNTYLVTTLGLTAAKVEPQTCQACHDPHATSLRLEDDTHMLPAGFRVRNAGAGALCMLCHNSRNGARADTGSTFPKTAITRPDGTKYAVRAVGTPHDSTAADIFTGHNLFFTDSYVRNTGKHFQYVADTCVGCHVNINVGGVSLQTKAPNHTFLVDDTICATCHSNATTLTDETAGIAAQYTTGSVAMRQAIGQAAMALVNRLEAGSAGTTSVVTILGSSGNQSAEFTLDQISSIAGPSADPAARSPNDGQILITFTVPVKDPSKASGTITTWAGSITALVWKTTDQNGSAAPGVTLIDPAGLIARAIWNNAVLARDYSKGVHNWSFVQNALSNTTTALTTYVNTGALPSTVTAP